MALKRRVWTAGKIFLLCGALLGTYLLFAGIAMRMTLTMREVAVPDVKGRTVAAATDLLRSVGLSINVEQVRRVDPTVTAGAIMGQDPAAGVRTRQQRSVRVWISAGSRPSRVPALVGESVRAAEARLAKDALTVIEVAEIRSRAYPSDSVIAQTPPPDSETTAVSLLVNRGAPDASFVMPDLVGLGSGRAADILRARGFRVAVVSETPYPGVPAGIVLRHSPAAGLQVVPGEPISLEVSR